MNKHRWRRTRIVWLILLSLAAAPVAAQVANTERFLELLEDVPRLPMERMELEVDPSLGLEEISAMSVDAEGDVYVLYRPEAADPVVVLDPSGRFLRSWGAGMFGIPHGIRVDPDGNVWTVDSNTSKVYKFSAEGELLLEIQIDRPETGRGFCGAADLAFTADGHVLVADGYCNGRVIELDAGGRQVNEWGTRGTGPGQFVVVHSVAVGPDGVVYVADRENGRLQSFDRSGKLLGLWEYAAQLFSVAFSPSGQLYICVNLGGDPEESYLIQIDPATGEMLGRIEGYGHEMAFSPDGSLWPATNSGEVLVFRPRRRG